MKTSFRLQVIRLILGRIRHGQMKGFSLVEVTLSLGLVSFAILAVVGVLPTTYQSMRDSSDRMIEAGLVREITTEAARGSFGDLATFCQKAFYFDWEGRPVLEAEAYYKVEASLSDPEIPLADDFDPSEVPHLGGSLMVLKIDITRRAFAGSEGRATNSYTFHVANSGF